MGFSEGPNVGAQGIKIHGLERNFITPILIKELAESKVAFQVRLWVKGTDYWGAYFDVIEAVKKGVHAQGISTPSRRGMYTSASTEKESRLHLKPFPSLMLSKQSIPRISILENTKGGEHDEMDSFVAGFVARFVFCLRANGYRG